MIRTLPADAATIVRAYPPMVVCFAAALALTALVFDVFYLVASPGLTLAAVYTIPVLAGLIAGLVAAADDLELERRVLVRTIVATVAVGITNVVVVAMVSAMRRTGPSDWGAGGRAILFAGCTVLSVAITIVATSHLIRSLGLDLKTKELLYVVLDIVTGNQHGAENHLRAAMRNGLTVKELAEACVQIIHVCGITTWGLTGYKVCDTAKRYESELAAENTRRASV